MSKKRTQTREAKSRSIVSNAFNTQAMLTRLSLIEDMMLKTLQSYEAGTSLDKEQRKELVKAFETIKRITTEILHSKYRKLSVLNQGVINNLIVNDWLRKEKNDQQSNVILLTSSLDSNMDESIDLGIR